MENEKGYIMYGIIAILIIASLCWIGYRHYNSAATADGRSAIDTVEQVKRNDKSARHDVDNAADQIESAQSELDAAGTDLDNAAESVDQLQESVKSDQDTIGECNDLVESGRADIATERSIIADVDQANQGTGTQN